MASEDGQAIKILLDEMFTEINPVFSTLGYYHNTYGNWHAINGALNQELLQEKHNPNFSANLDKKVLVNFSNTSGFVIFPIYWAPLTPTNEHHLWAEEVRKGTAKSAASTTPDKDPQAVKAQQTKLPQLPRGTLPYHPHPLQWVSIYICHFTTAKRWDNGTDKKNS